MGGPCHSGKREMTREGGGGDQNIIDSGVRISVSSYDLVIEEFQSPLVTSLFLLIK